MPRKKFSNINEYILDAPRDVRKILNEIRSEIQARVPSATETISYNIPAFQDPKPFIYFASFQKHIGIYPPVKDKELKQKLKPFLNEKGNASFPLKEDIPIKLIGAMAVSLWKWQRK